MAANHNPNKNPTGRNGYQPGGRRPIPKLICDEVIELVRECIARETPKPKIRAFVEEINGARHGLDGPKRCSRDTFYKLLRYARLRMLRDAEMDFRQARAISVEMYKSIVRDEDCSARDRMHARERLDKLLGLEGHHGPREDGVDEVREYLREIDELTGVGGRFAESNGEAA